jgi:type 1 glutamine amidotransferase
MKRTLRSLLIVALLATPSFSSFAAEARRVIVCTVTTGFRHSSIPFAEKTLKKLGDDSKAFTVVDIAQQPTANVPHKPNKPKDLAPNADDKAKAKYADEMKRYDADMAKWTPEMDEKAKAAQTEYDAQMKASMAKLSPEHLKAERIDAVIFANTTGDLPLPDRDGFIKWIEDGHAFIGMHSASDTFHHFEGYLDMLGGEFAGHNAQVPADMVAGDAKHPANAGIGEKWQLAQEEMYHIKHQDRAKVRSLWFMQHDPNKVEEKVFFPVSWCRMAGKGRVFYTSLGHREDLWDDTDAVKDRKNSPETSRQYQAHILGGIKWALGLVPGSVEPNPSVN